MQRRKIQNPLNVYGLRIDLNKTLMDGGLMVNKTIHFSEDEFRCKCCGGLPENRENLEKLMTTLEHIRYVYQRPMVVVSGYRCDRYNRKVGGVPNSYHTKGLAADIAIASNTDRFALIAAAIGSGIARIGVYRTFTHIDIGESPIHVMWIKEDR